MVADELEHELDTYGATAGADFRAVFNDLKEHADPE